MRNREFPTSLRMEPHVFPLITFCLLTQLISSGEAVLPDSYPTFTAEKKQDILWSNIQNSSYDMSHLPTEPYNMANASKILSPIFLVQAFMTTSDEMPKGRPRIVHTYGTVCKVELIIYPNSTYTGIFQSGGIGLARLSTAKLSSDYFGPGVALKILINGQPSQNLHVINNPDGQHPDRNFFARPLRNIIPQSTRTDPGTVAATKAFAAALNKIPGELEDKPESVNIIGLYEAAAVTPDGRRVEKVVAPYLVSFVPNANLTWDPKNSEDFRVKLGGIKEGTVLYRVAVKRFLDDEEDDIGQVVTRGPVVASEYGDQTLFFQHARRSWKDGGAKL